MYVRAIIVCSVVCMCLNASSTVDTVLQEFCGKELDEGQRLSIGVGSHVLSRFLRQEFVVASFYEWFEEEGGGEGWRKGMVCLRVLRYIIYFIG
ncbi:hypothetical protein F4604DRAFT_1779185, partial [Suillus subluteus]